jgi:ubiquinone/menaquinone biosynthesis C-methylase UbiE
MSIWGRIFAAIYDPAFAAAEAAGLRENRIALLSLARGDVLELGAGTGLNLPHYPDGVKSILCTEPEEPMARRLRARIARRGDAKATVVQAPAEALPVPDGSIDTVVATLVLCTVNDPAASLAEVRRVLAPDGRLLFLEHVRSDDPKLARWQDRLHPAWVRFGHGCHCNRDTLSSIKAAGFDVHDVREEIFPKFPAIVRPLIIGAATVAAPS